MNVYAEVYRHRLLERSRVADGDEDTILAWQKSARLYGC